MRHSGSLLEDEPIKLPADFFEKPQKERVHYVRALVSRSRPHETFSEVRRNWHTSGNPAAAQALTAVVRQDCNIAVQREALAALGRIPDRAVIPAMLHGLELPDRACKFHALFAFERLRAREGVPGLIHLLEDPRFRLYAARALVAIRDERGLSPLKAAASRGRWWQRRRLRDYASALETALGY